MKPNRSLFNPAPSLLLCAFLSVCAQAQPAFTELSSPEPRRGEGFGDEFGGLPDLTGDGVGEFYVVGYFGAYVFDGQSLEPLYKIDSPNNSTGFPTHSAGDVNGDGTPDLMLGDYTSVAGEVGSVDFFDGKTGERLMTLDSPEPVSKGYFGSTLRLLPDMTGDGKQDWLIHQPEFQARPGQFHIFDQSRAGRAYIFDSQTREVVRTIQNTEAAYNFQVEHVEVIPDVDRDGKPELLVGSWHATVQRDGRTTSNAARVVVRSLQSGEVLYELIDPEPVTLARVGLPLAAIGDVTGDGIGDIAVGAPWKDNFAGAILIFSGVDGRWLRTVRSPNPRPSSTNGGKFGRRIEVLPDLNGDGVPELWTQEDGGSLPLFTYLHDGATSGLLRTIQYPGNAINPFGGPRYFIGTVRQESPPGIRAHLFGLGHIADYAGRVYYMPFTAIQPTRLKTLGRTASGFRLQVTGEPGRNLEIQASSDFKAWEPVATVTTGNEPVEAEDSTAAGLMHRFYRAVQKE